MNKDYYVVIMAGGIGTRFWPMSTVACPKQFIDVMGVGKTLLQQTFARFANFCPPENTLVVTGMAYRDLVLAQLPEIKPENVLCEPHRKNTAPCIAYANYKIHAVNPNATVVVAPADHVVLKEDVFSRVIEEAAEKASQNDWLITLGITPSYPNTGYGYIQFDSSKEIDPACPSLRKVKLFTEKPEFEMARTFVESGEFLWNAGLFIWSLKSAMKAFKEHLPEVDELFASGVDKYNTPQEAEYIQKVYLVCKGISVDYGVMEKARNVYVMAADFGWSDVGTWGSLYELRPKNADENTLVGKNIFTYDTHGCIVNAPKDKVVVLQGLEDCIVVETAHSLLVCKRDQEQMLRRIVSDVSEKAGEKYV
ncbi:MAG: mannose-1-phosphate guanylyltransferase [Bacteroidales bacterium]|nr:mannose-1-phosphate guanylyltransferase [Bacteroidales bacterium]